jgi:hypothetical protein
MDRQFDRGGRALLESDGDSADRQIVLESDVEKLDISRKTAVGEQWE